MKNDLFPDRELWPQQLAIAAKRKVYGISLHAAFDDKHPALPYMTEAEREAFLSACNVLTEGKEEQKTLIADVRSFPEAAPDPEAAEIAKNFRLELREYLLLMRSEDFRRYIEAEERLGEAVGVIEQIVTAAIDRLPDKEAPSHDRAIG
jgi:hypothetical protein